MRRIEAPETSPGGQDRRFGMFLDAYGLEMTRSEVVAAMLVRQGMPVARGNET